MYEVWTDGTSKYKKIKKKQEKFGHSAIAVIIKKDGQVVHKYSGYVGILDNNQAEYEALIYAIDVLIELGATSATFYTDSNLIEKQMNNNYSCHSENITPYYLKAKKLMYMIPEWRIKWIPRGSNRDTDKMADKFMVDWLNKNKD